MENASFAGDWPAGARRRFSAATGRGPKRRFAAATGKGPKRHFAAAAGKGPKRRYAAGKNPGKGRGRHRHLEELEHIGALREMRGGGPFFGPPRGRGRARRRRGDVRMALLMLLSEEPRNGYQLMQTIEERSDGNWRPSPGSVYPILSQLEDEGLVRATEREGAKLFELTDAGRQHVAQADVKTPPWEAGEDQSPQDLRRVIGDVARAAAMVHHAGSEQQMQRAREALINARRTLYKILAEDEDL